MPSIAPFSPLRYNPDSISDLGAVIAPPYDVISAERRQQLLARDTHNFIRLILPEGDDQTKYTNAATLLKQWMNDGVLVREPGDAVYLYTQEFAHPVTGEKITRHGFMARVTLVPFSQGEILPHERTLSGPKADRLKLMEATDANIEPIFGMYKDPAGESARRLIALAGSREPLLRATDPDGVTHTMWKIDDAADIATFQTEVGRSKIYIVDGHHRYETALNYKNLLAQDGRATPHHDAIMMFLAPMDDPGMVILPTHRIVHSLENFDFQGLLGRLGEAFDVQSMSTVEEGMAQLEQNADRPSYLLLSGGRPVLISLKNGADPSQLVDSSLHPTLVGLDVTILHEYILERLLGISKEAQASQTNLRYVKSTDEAVAEARNPDAQIIFLMNATRLEQVEEVAASGNVMPQKSTYFYPKLASGLLINTLW